MAKNTIDKLFEENLKNHKQQPSRNLWEDIEGRLDNKVQKKTRVVWLSIAASIILLIVSATIWLSQYNIDTKHSHIAEEKKEIENMKENEEEKDFIVEERESLEEEKEKIVEKIVVSETDTNRSRNIRKSQQVKSKDSKKILKPKMSPKKKVEKPKGVLKFNTEGNHLAENTPQHTRTEEDDFEVTVSVSLHSKPKTEEYKPEPKKPSKIGEMWKKVKKAKGREETASNDN